VKDWRCDEDWRWHPLNCRRPFTKYEAFKDLIKLANHQTRKVPFDGDMILVKRGQHLTSQVKLAKRWKWSRTKVQRFLKSAGEYHELDVKTSTLYTLITVCNYDRYQSRNDQEWNTDETPMKHERNTDGHKQELEECEELKKTTTTEEVVSFFVNKNSMRFTNHELDVNRAVDDITAYVITHQISRDDIGPLVFRWPENHRNSKQHHKLNSRRNKEYGSPGITDV